MYFTKQKLKVFVSLAFFLGFCQVFFFIVSDPRHGNDKQNRDTAQSEEGDVTDRSGMIDTQQLYRSGKDKPRRKEIILNNTNALNILTPRGPVKIRCDGDTRIIAIVSSLPSNGQLRQAIRETWGKVAGNKTHRMRTMFVTGRKGGANASKEDKELLEEIKTHGDVLLGNFVNDLKIRTSLPLMLGLHWALSYCPSFEYIYFGNDGIVVMEEKLIQRLDYCEQNNISDARTWMGRVSPYSQVQREPTSIFYVSQEQYDKEYFPPFCTEENGFVFTRIVAKEFLHHAFSRPIVQIADVFCAIIGHERNWTMVDDELFTRSSLSKNNVCAAHSSVTAHAPEKPDELIVVWQKINDKNLLKDCMDPDLDLVLPTHVDNRPYLDKVLAYKFNHPHVCFDKEGKPLNIFMIVLISTPPDHAGMRNAIRETWCKDKVVLGEQIRCVFVLGQLATETAELKSNLRKEDVKYGDIIQASFSESFQNLTLKVILGLKWITENCDHAKYFYKGDEDMFVNFRNIISYIKNLRNKGEAMTKFFIGSRLYASIRYSPNVPEHAGLKRYHVPDHMYFGHFYPPYCSGGGYILSAETVPAMYKESLRTSLINVDDAFQGILTKKLGYGPIGNTGFKSWGGKTDTCSLREKTTMTVHGIGKKPENLHDVWNKYNNATVNCTEVGV